MKAFNMINQIQVAAQDISTMIRSNQRSIIFLINNGGYTIEVEIHDGPYNVIKNWNYCGLVDAIHNGEGKCWTTKVSTFIAFLVLNSLNPYLNEETIYRFAQRKNW